MPPTPHLGCKRVAQAERSAAQPQSVQAKQYKQSKESALGPALVVAPALVALPMPPTTATLPLMLPLRQSPRIHHCQCPDIAVAAALLLPPKQCRCCTLPFLCGQMGQGGPIIWQSGGGCFFLKIKLIQLYVHRVKKFFFLNNKCTRTEQNNLEN
jgi:hypothetical protein